MDNDDTLKARVAQAVKGAYFYPVAEGWTGVEEHRHLFAGCCPKWSAEAERVLTEAGLEVLMVCQTRGASRAPFHIFLMIRNPQTGSVVYYDPSGEQYGLTGAHRCAYTRQEIAAQNQGRTRPWDGPIPCKNYEVHTSWQFRKRDFGMLQQKWGSELRLPIPFKSARVEPAKAGFIR